MAFRRSITSRAKLLLFHQQQRVALPFSRDDNEHEILPRSRNPDCFQRRQFGTGNHLGNFYRSRNLFQDLRFGVPAPVFVRNMSSHPVTFDIADVLGDKAVEVASQAAPVVNEVAIAAADSFFPVAALQHLLGYVHTFTGLNWWASIVLTTVLIRTLQLPLLIYQIKSDAILGVPFVCALSCYQSSRMRNVWGPAQFSGKDYATTPLNPRMFKITEELTSRSISGQEALARANELSKGHGLSIFFALHGVLVAVPVFFCFLFAIDNMAGKVQSFKEGGALWFTDLATPDPFYILPVLTAMTVWIVLVCKAQERLEGPSTRDVKNVLRAYAAFVIPLTAMEKCKAQELLEGNPSARDVKNVLMAFAALVIPLTATFPKATFCYLITSSLYSLACALALQNPEIKKMLGIPIKSLEREVKGMKEVKKK